MASLCSVVAPFLSLAQQIVNSLFSAFSFLGISAPNVTSIVYSALGCTTS